ncbi:MAG: DUF4738 domain-containing protein [Prevotellaceae bacterium]|nr:DUF4738 domain-containing protein [Candidatus Colivivens equi]
MKRLSYLTLCTFVLLISACNNGKQPTVAIPDTTKIETPKDSILSLQEFEVTDTMSVNGVVYQYTYAFKNDTTLPVVTNSYGYKYYDNIVELTIKKDTATVYTHTFTKESFRSHIDDDNFDNYSLLGFNINYLRLDNHQRFHFISDVGDCDAAGIANYATAIDITPDWKLILTPVVDTEVGPEYNMTNDPTGDEGV